MIAENIVTIKTLQSHDQVIKEVGGLCVMLMYQLTYTHALILPFLVSRSQSK